MRSKIERQLAACKIPEDLLAGARIYGPGEHPAAPELVGRIYRVATAGRRLYTAFNSKKGKR